MIYRAFVGKKTGYDIESLNLLKDLRENLGVADLEGIKIVSCYDIEGIGNAGYEQIKSAVLAEPPTDILTEGTYPIGADEYAFMVKYLPGQYDQRSDSAEQCAAAVTGEPVRIASSRLYVCKGPLSPESIDRIEKYCINPVDSAKAPLDKPETLAAPCVMPGDIPSVTGFIHMSDEEACALGADMSLAMSAGDLVCCREYFKTAERRDPTVTELRVIDTYWSDHCRHTTFLTEITDIAIEDGPYKPVIQRALDLYLEEKGKLPGRKGKPVCLMDLAVTGMSALKSKGMIPDLDESDEINACSIAVTADIDGKTEDWLVMFKNETHNHPTEIEPFGGAATCLGGAIRDPLSGRSYVYQAMRVTGGGDPRAPIGQTPPGKLPQRTIARGAAHGFSSYGNQIGLATGQVSEIYDEGFIAKRMEIGAVVGAAPKSRVRRETPVAGDAVILVGGRTGRDGCGGATGASKEHTEQSLSLCGAEVQKGNPPTERKLQRLFRNPAACALIKRCNDFGAGGAAVAIGELADGLEIDLDKILKKYEGLDGTELAISESQERMAVVTAPGDAERFIALAGEENLEAVIVARVAREPRLVMKWRGRAVVDISRAFLDTNGARQAASARIVSPAPPLACDDSDPEKWPDNLSRLNTALQKGLSEQFDSTVGAGTVLMPFGGARQLTPPDAMAAKLPAGGDTDTVTVMSYGYDPDVSRNSPFHGAVYAITEALAKLTAVGADYKAARLSLQEYFERMTSPEKWGKPLAALLGAFLAQMSFGVPAIGGKDSMSGTFKDLHVPPTVAAFALAAGKTARILSPEFKRAGHSILLAKARHDRYDLPDFGHQKYLFDTVRRLNCQGRVFAASSRGKGGISACVSKMALGNGIGARLDTREELYMADYGSIVLETDLSPDEAGALGLMHIGDTIAEECIIVNGCRITLDQIEASMLKPLEGVFPTGWLNTGGEEADSPIPDILSAAADGSARMKRSQRLTAKPRVLIPVFPGTNCEYDTSRAFEKAGGFPDQLVIRNLTQTDLRESIDKLAAMIRQANIIALPGGFSAGDEPGGSGKYIVAIFNSPRIKEAVDDLLTNRDGLILGICNGFQALLKLGLLTRGRISPLTPDSPALVGNLIGRHVSCMARTRIVSAASPWLRNTKPGDVHVIPISHGEGRFVAPTAVLEALAANGQIASQYVDMEGKPSMDARYNPNGSYWAIEGITSPDGRVFGKMGHSERIGDGLYKNIPGDKDQHIFEAGIGYFD